MAYGNRRGGGGKGSGSGVRLTGLFKTKRPGLYVGSIDTKKITELIDLIKKASKQDKGLTIFMWKSKFEDGPLFSINADVAQDRNERKPSKRRIEEDDDDDSSDDDEDETEDDPFKD